MLELQQEEAKLGMRDKPASEMSSENLKLFMRGLGLPGLYYPMADLVTNSKGGFDWEVGMIHTAEEDKALWVPSEQSAERVYGKLLRACPTPQMMLAFRKLLSRVAPDSTNCLFAIFGDPSTGKSHIIKEVGALVHPQGCVVVDCGGLNMRELFWRTVIDYGQGVKEQLEKRVADGKAMTSSLDLLEAEFPGSVVRHGNASPKINWDAIGARRLEKDGDSGEMKAAEDRGAAVIRANNLLKFIYEKEGIAVQSNAFGIKTVPGELYESFVSGRPPFLDEFNKSQKGTLDAYQTFLEWANGNDKNPVIRVPNPMATTDADSPAYLEFDRNKKKLGWFVGIAGNDPKDGATTQALSESMEARLNIIRIGDPSKQDWEHRYSQIVSGFPLKPWYDYFEADAKADPEAFSKMLIAYRFLGLSASERKLVPGYEVEALKNFQNTVAAIGQMAAGYYDQQQLAKAESAKANDTAFKNCQNELAIGRKNIRITFRTAIQEHAEALKSSPEVLKKGSVSLVKDLADSFKNVAKYGESYRAPGWHRLGSNLVNVRREAIANATVDMPNTQAALVTLWETNGIFPSELKEAKASNATKPLVDLLRYDAISEEGLGDTEDLEKKRESLMATLKSLRPDMLASADKVIPLKNLALAEKAIASAREASETSVILPNTDFDTVTKSPIIIGEALPNYDLKNPLEDPNYELVDFRAVLGALAVREYGEKNRERIWPVKLVERLKKKDRPNEEDQRRFFDPLLGKSLHGYDMCILGAAGSTVDSMNFLYVIEDKERDAMIIAGPESISPELQSLLSKSRISYVVKNDPATVTRISDFMIEGHTERLKAQKLSDEEEVREIEKSLLQAFSSICRDKDSSDMIPEGTIIGSMVQEGYEPTVYTSFVVRTKGIRL